MLATIQQYKTRYAVSGEADDDAIESVLAGVSAQIARAAGRMAPDGSPCLELSSLELILSVRERGVQTLWLPAYPIAAVASVIEAPFGDFDNGTELVEGEDFIVEPHLGGLVRRGGCWMFGPRTVAVNVDGGYVPAGEEAEEGQTALPADLTEMALLQAKFAMDKRPYVGQRSPSAGGAGGSLSFADDDLLPIVRATAERFRRLMG